MATIIHLSVVVPTLPDKWTPPSSSSARISTPIVRTLIPAGPSFVGYARRKLGQRSFEEDDRLEEEERNRHNALNGDMNGEDDLGVGDEEEDPLLLAQDPKEWKKQDHYKVLGLSALRYKATQDQIKIAHRKKVLKHHPDKKAGQAGDANDDAFFKCIQKAFDVLSNPERRRQFDSVDPHLLSLEDDDLPDVKEKLSFKKFQAEFGPVFEREARFSKREPVPLLGEEADSKDSVEGFYDFWYNFDSWRSFEYLDKEINEGSDNRDDKRYTEKKNKTERARRKKEDIARLRNIVDTAMQLDPRIKRIKQEEKLAREAKKKGKSATPDLKTKEEEAKKAAEDAKKKEEEEKAAKEAAKKAKAAAANAAKKARRAQRTGEDSGTATPTGVPAA